MKYFFILISIFFTHLVFACDCKIKKDIDIKDWNDSDVVFTGVLTNIEVNNDARKLTFSILKFYRGKINAKTVTYSVNKNNEPNEHQGHDLFYHVEPLILNQEWLIFSSSILRNKKLSYEFKNPVDDFCTLSRPIASKDNYLKFIETLFKEPNIANKIYYKDDMPIAMGSLENGIPTGIWKYFKTENMDHYYWEGNYINGKRDGVWAEKAINFKNEKVAVKEEIYKDGKILEYFKYNFIGEKQSHEIYNDKINIKFVYENSVLSSKLTYDKKKNITTIEKYSEGKVISTKKVWGGIIKV